MKFTHLPGIPKFRIGRGSRHQIQGASDDCDGLPSYQSLEDPALTTTTAPSGKGVTEAPRGSNGLLQQEHSNIYSKYFRDEDDDDDEEWEVLVLKMVPDPGARLYKKALWVAVLEVKTTDIPRLMREGFFWSAENVVPEEGFMSRETKPGWTQFGFHYKRTWVLVDKSNPTPKWVGLLDVVTRSYEILPNFQVQDLTRGNIYEAFACNGLGNIIYDYYHRWPRKSFNCIYDDKPLQGWWPWPKEEGAFATSAGPGSDRVGEPSAHVSITGNQPHQEVEDLPVPDKPREPEEPNKLQPCHPRSASCVIL